jgi:hypothetical protein
MNDLKWDQAHIRELTARVEAVGQLLKKKKNEGRDVRTIERLFQTAERSIRLADYETGKEYLLKAARELKNIYDAKRRARGAP